MKARMCRTLDRFPPSGAYTVCPGISHSTKNGVNV